MNFSEIVQLSVQQRIVLVDAIWESITADRKKIPLSESQIQEMEERITSAEKKPSYLSQWEKMKKNSRQSAIDSLPAGQAGRQGTASKKK